MHRFRDVERRGTAHRRLALEGRQEREEMTLGAADARDLVDVEDLHRARGASRRARRPRRPSCAEVKRSATSSCARAAQRAAARDRGRARPRCSASASCLRSASDTPFVRADDGRRASRVRGDDRAPGRQRLDRDDGGPLVLRGEEECVDDSEPAGDVSPETEKSAGACDAELVRRRFDRSTVWPVAEDDEGSGDPARVKRLQDPDQIEGALDRSETTCEADEELVAVEAELGAGSDPFTSARCRCDRSNPYGMTSIRSSDATPSATRSSRTSPETAISAPVRSASRRRAE